jgi:glutathione S-transferase
VKINTASATYCETVMGWSPMKEWVEGAKAEPEEVEELEIEF